MTSLRQCHNTRPCYITGSGRPTYRWQIIERIDRPGAVYDRAVSEFRRSFRRTCGSDSSPCWSSGRCSAGSPRCLRSFSSRMWRRLPASCLSSSTCRWLKSRCFSPETKFKINREWNRIWNIIIPVVYLCFCWEAAIEGNRVILSSMHMGYISTLPGLELATCSVPSAPIPLGHGDVGITDVKRWWWKLTVW